jgi:UDPglucose 6-dehydrogenase
MPSCDQVPTVAVVGCGYVGLTATVCLAELGIRVIGQDIDSLRIEGLLKGEPPYYERGLAELLRAHLERGTVSFTTSLEHAASQAKIVMVAVGTPAGRDGQADLSAINAVSRGLRNRRFGSRRIVVIRSTAPPGTSDRLAYELGDVADVAVLPEFLREGSAIQDFMKPDRIVIGAERDDVASEILQLFSSIDAPRVVTSRRNAELIKGVSNAFLAMKISFANEIANLCDVLDADAPAVLECVGLDHRIGPAFLGAGIGFGGPCLEKDCRSLEYVAARAGAPSQMVRATLDVNERQALRVRELLLAHCGSLRGLRVGVWGLAFKGGTDDVRDSVALRVIQGLVAEGAVIEAYDPKVRDIALPLGARHAESALAAADADALVVLTDWPEFATIDARDYAASVARGLVIDGRNVLDDRAIVMHGLTYHGIGRRRRPAASALQKVG